MAASAPTPNGYDLTIKYDPERLLAEQAERITRLEKEVEELRRNYDRLLQLASFPGQEAPRRSSHRPWSGQLQVETLPFDAQ